MSNEISRAIGAGVFCLAIFATGFWLTRVGKPYSGLLLNVHKLLALAAAVLFGLALRQVHQAAGLSGAALAAGIAAEVCFLALIISGGLASIDRPTPALVTRLHHLLPYLGALLTALTLFVLGRPA